jgi:hypothetical protein
VTVPAFEVHWDEVDGVPALWAGQGAVQGPLQACLLFGVGICDEVMLQSGIDHLIEHLALHRLGNKTYQWNGQVKPVSTAFRVMGGAADVVEFFAHVAGELREPPVARLADEARVLRVESQRRKAYQPGFDLSLRCGPFGEGLLGWQEHGLDRLRPDEVVDWARTRFTAQNAVLWLSGPIPPGLSLAALPQGTPPPRAAVPHLPLPPRCWATAQTRAVSLSVVSDHDQWGIPPVMSIARQRALERLRTRDAISYAVEYLHLRIGGGKALEYLVADGADGTHQQILDGLMATLTELAEVGPTAEELAAFQRMALQVREHPQHVLAYLDSTAERRLLNQWAPGPAESEEKLLDLTTDVLRRDLASTGASLLAIGPNALGRDLPGWSSYPDWSYDWVEGRTFTPIAAREKGCLVVGEAGVSWVLDENRRRTIRWSDLVACFTWDNGLRTLLGPTGTVVQVVPWNWQGGEALTALVDAWAGAPRLVRLGEGSTHHRENPNNPDSVVDNRWLASIVGAVQGNHRIDLLLDTQGLYVLQHPQGCKVAQRLKELSTSDRARLLAEDSRNTRLPLDDIELARLGKRPLVSINTLKATLVVQARDGSSFKVHLRTDKQVETLRGALAKALGERFRA